jgi:Holliday junction DNA helicase RuvA
MIALVGGEVAVRRADHVVIETAGGVGYRLAVSTETLKVVPAVGRPVSLHAHLVVRDDTMSLYGFATEEERDLFLALLGVQSVGPKVALAVLSGGPPRDIIAALAAGDHARLQAVPGIGKRTAERIVLELKEKLPVVVGAAPAGAETSAAPARGGQAALVERALVEMGFRPPEAERATAALGDKVDTAPLPELVRLALAHLVR